jgi:hypothetical protein
MVLLFIVMGCSASKPTEPVAPAQSAEPVASAPPPSVVGVVDATILVTDCSNVSDYSAAVAQKTMRRLVEGCSEIPNGRAEFIATLQPGGRIEISEVEGASSTVPICVLKHQLEHQVKVKKACKMHVQMEQKAPAPTTVDAGA